MTDDTQSVDTTLSTPTVETTPAMDSPVDTALSTPTVGAAPAPAAPAPVDAPAAPAPAPAPVDAPAAPAPAPAPAPASAPAPNVFETFLNELEAQVGKMEMAITIFHFSVIKQKLREMIAKARSAPK